MLYRAKLSDETPGFVVLDKKYLYFVMKGEGFAINVDTEEYTDNKRPLIIDYEEIENLPAFLFVSVAKAFIKGFNDIWE